MDFEKAYEDGYKNHVKDLSQTDKAFLAGVANAYFAIETFAANADSVYGEVPEGETEILAKMKKDIRKQVINDLRDWIRGEWYETIVSMIDEIEDGKVKANDDYNDPEPLDDEDIDFDEE